MSRKASVCMECGTTDEIHHHNCATHERGDGMTRDELLTNLATELTEWPASARGAKQMMPEGWYWRGTEAVHVGGGIESFTVHCNDWLQRREELSAAHWSEGDERLDRIAQSDASGDHYAEDEYSVDQPCCTDGHPCGVPPEPDGDAYCLGCPNYAEDSDGGSALSQALSMPSKYHVRLKGAWCDVYDVLQAFGVTNPADAHAIKKMLMPGKRGHKDGIQDRREAIQSLHRAIELEDGQ